MMRQDLDILKELFLPLLEEIAAYSPDLAAELAGGEAFWVYFNSVVLQGERALHKLLTGYGAKDAAQCDSLCAEYLYYMALQYCAGQTNPTVDALLRSGDERFAVVVGFQQDMLTAIRQAGRAELKAELEQAAEYAGEDVADKEIATAFNTMQMEVARDDLRKQLKEWDEERPVHEQPAKRKRRRPIALLFFRFAAAAAVFTGGVVGIVKVYDRDKSRNSAPSTQSSPETSTEAAKQTPAGADTTITNAASQQNIVSGTTNTTPATKAARRDSANTVHLPHIVLKGTVADVQTGETITDVLVTMEDDKGNKQTVVSKDGTFSFDLKLHSDFVVYGQKDKYRSARLSLSTKDVKDTDADDVIRGTLKLSKEPE